MRAAAQEIDKDEVLARVRARVRGFARARVSPADAEDVAQETLLVLTTKYAHVEPLDELVALGIGIAQRKCLAAWRKQARRGRLGETTLPEPGEDGRDPIDEAEGREPDPERLALHRQRVALLVEAASRLGDRCRFLLRRKLEGASLAEIAQEAGRPVNTVYSWDHRCHERLKQLLGELWPFVTGLAPAAAPSRAASGSPGPGEEER